MILINTTTGWNLGDNLICEGAVELLGILGRPMVFVDRHILKGGRRVHQESKMLPDPEELAACADALVIAGTPEWTGAGLSPLYAACAKRGIPTYIVGVGRAGNRSDILRLKANIVRATVRDEAARASLEANGVPCERFVDPAFFAPRPKCDKKFELVVCFRAAGGNGTYSRGLDAYWRKFAEIHDPEIVTVHEPKEVRYARDIFGRDRVFFSSEYHAYMPIYASATRVFSGRIHGAVPAIASGATTWLVYNQPKVECMSTVAAVPGSTLTMLSYGDAIPEELPEVDPKPTLKFIAEQGMAHAKYLRSPIESNREEATDGLEFPQDGDSPE